MKEFDDAEAAVGRMAEAGVVRAVIVGCDELSSFEALAAVDRLSGHGVDLRATVGIHPHEASSAGRELSEELTDLAASPSVCAIGEIGLDYYYDNSPRDEQRRVFEMQVDWARRVSMPIVLHLRSARDARDGDAYGDAVRILRERASFEAGGIVHCFSGTREDARRFLELGFHISFAGPVTYPSADELRAAAAIVPLDRILCETDAPYLAPQRHRGRRNEPAYVAETYAKIADVRGDEADAFAEAVWENADRLLWR